MHRLTIEKPENYKALQREMAYKLETSVVVVIFWDTMRTDGRVV